MGRSSRPSLLHRNCRIGVTTMSHWKGHHEASAHPHRRNEWDCYLRSARPSNGALECGPTTAATNEKAIAKCHSTGAPTLGKPLHQPLCQPVQPVQPLPPPLRQLPPRQSLRRHLLPLTPLATLCCSKLLRFQRKPPVSSAVTTRGLSRTFISVQRTLYRRL